MTGSIELDDTCTSAVIGVADGVTSARARRAAGDVTVFVTMLVAVSALLIVETVVLV